MQKVEWIKKKAVCYHARNHRKLIIHINNSQIVVKMSELIYIHVPNSFVKIVLKICMNVTIDSFINPLWQVLLRMCGKPLQGQGSSLLPM